MELKRTLPSRSLLQGMPYTPAAATDIRETFAKAREQLKPKTANVRPMRKVK